MAAVSFVDIVLARSPFDLSAQGDPFFQAGRAFGRYGFPLTSVCPECGERTYPGVGCPSKDGAVRCFYCVGGKGFGSVAEFDAFEASHKELSWER